MANTPILNLLRVQGASGAWFKDHVWSQAGLLETAAFAGSLFLAYGAVRWLRGKLRGRMLAGREKSPGEGDWTVSRLPALFFPAFTLLFMEIILGVSLELGWQPVLTRVFIKFCEAWLAIQLFAAVILPPGWARGVAVTVGSVFALEMFGILDHLIGYTDSLALSFKDQRISLLEVIQAGLMLAVMLPLINRLCQFIEGLFERSSGLNPRVKVLVTKITKVGLYGLAFVTVLNLVGINLQMLAVFSGAVGLGIGFGLQKVVSNLVSGVILLMDNSIKPGDVIEVGGVYGWVESMNARFASMVTRDGKAILIPNDDLISNQVVNWSFTGPTVRVKIPVSVAYSTDLTVAMELMLGACEGGERILDNPKPVVLLKDFGDNGVLLELRLWILHPQHGMASVASDVRKAIWGSFAEHGIELPFPQRDLRVKEPVTVRLEEPEKPGGPEKKDG
ncbi:mechanosensitive ion channel family protein [Fundidesulfovibrio terrae]|uniref:mechanosensitive ion channel family protein n=1 Tax=Fundidesulfovibrio terrae TaxID=2922866 RepID=UPI001FB03C30|nr:mechanosensitive ion channel domain-containing protein [Fundidesulfovibrio terrae]